MNITINATNVTINAVSEPGCTIEPCDHTALSTHEYVVLRHAEWEANNPDNYSIDPYDMLAEPLTNLPVSFAFSVPGRAGDGYAALNCATAKLAYNGDRFYYVIDGRTTPSRKLLYAIGCVYSRSRCDWLCMDYAVLKPYIIPGSIVG